MHRNLVKLGYLKDISTAGGPGGWNPVTHLFDDTADAIYRAYVRQIGAGAVAAGGFITLMKTIPTIISSFKESIGSIKDQKSRQHTITHGKRFELESSFIRQHCIGFINGFYSNDSRQFNRQ